MKVRDIMTRPVVSVHPETSVPEAARLMLHHRISGLPVVDASDRILGIVTEGDLLRRAETGTERHHKRWLEWLITPGRLAEEYTHAHGRKVSEVMTENVATIGLDAPVSEVVGLMESRHINRVPVIDNGRLFGIVSRANLVRALVSNLAHTPVQQPVNDQQIRDRILTDLKAQSWGPRFSIDVTVKDGVVDLYGTITDERERTALVVLAENVPGVKVVHDHITWVDPVSGFVIQADGPGSSAAA